MGYAKLFSSITESSLWVESKEVKILFVSMMARADSSGFVEAALPGLAKLAHLTIDETEQAVSILESPDKNSKNTDHEGRRILKVPGGWVLLNYEEYRKRTGDDERREYMREYMRNYRAERKHDVNSVNSSKPSLKQAEAEGRGTSDAATALCMDRGVQGRKDFDRLPGEFSSTMDTIAGILQISDDDQFGFPARLAYADAIGFEFPKPIWDYVGRAKKKRNKAGYLKSCVRDDLGERWQEFLDATPSEAHCQALLAKAGREQSV